MSWYGGKEREAYERGRNDERDRIRRAVDGDDEGCGALGCLIFLIFVLPWILHSCRG
ncbi:hypothetical protein ACFV97_18025 [Streptomyces sp. NPDC059913]|uniref:hypothetical protein n=1 Tax=unclassified Streptomyces TaxID=2593676 RepID=UPI003667F832